MNLTKRQADLLKKLFSKSLSTNALLESLTHEGYSLSEDTLQRELKLLNAQNLLHSEGAGPARVHLLTSLGKMRLQWSNQELDTFLRNDDRLPIRYDGTVPGSLALYLHNRELVKEESTIVKQYQDFIHSIESSLLARWRQKWLIEFAWKSSAIEGNTYSELETETLLIDKIEATGKSHQEAVMIVNHQRAYDFIIEQKASFRTITLAQVLKLHELVIKDLDTSTGIRNAPVRISGSKYIPLSHNQQLSESLKESINAINLINQPVSKALAILLLIAYLQPFVDGNKRTSRLLANAILESYDYPPLTFGGIEPTRYRRACIAFYEMVNLEPMIEIMNDAYLQFRSIEQI